MAIQTEFLDIQGDEIPVRKTYSFGGQSYIFDFKENENGEFFTVEIFDINSGEFLFSNKIVYGQPIIDSLLAPFPDKIIPLNINDLISGGGIQTITRETLGKEIKLYTAINEV